MTPWTTLLVVELRKATDTRAARWLLGLIMALGLGLSILTRNQAATFAESLSAPVLPLAVLLPVVAVLAVTSDWGQRAALTTFALVPRRRRILTARLAACLVLVLVTALVASFFGGVSSLVFHPGALARADPALVGTSLWSVTALAIAAALSGAAIGSLLLNMPAAIGVTLVVPITYDVIVGLNAPTIGPWISSLAFTTWLADPNWTLAVVESSDGASVPSLGQAATSLLLWIIVPLAVGWWRQLRREVK